LFSYSVPLGIFLIIIYCLLLGGGKADFVDCRLTETQAGSVELDDSASLSGGQRERTSAQQQRDSAAVDRGRLSSPIPVGLSVSSFLLVQKGVYNSLRETHRRATERHLLYGITQCYLPPDTGERDPP